MADTKISADYVANPFTWDGTEILPGIKSGANGAGLVSALQTYFATLKTAQNEAPLVTIGSSGSVAIGAAIANTITISGTNTITSFDTLAAGGKRRVVFSGILTLTHHATSLILPGAANITTAVGDTAEFVSLGSGNWRCIHYQRANGQAVIGSSFTGGTLSSALNEAPQVSIASAASVAIGAAAANTIDITGTATITSFDTIAAGAVRCVVFAGILTLTHNGTSLILPGSASITTAAGDSAEFLSLGSGNWRCTRYTKISGAAIVGGGLTHFTEAVSTAAPNGTVAAASLTATNAATNVDAVFRAKGTGAILAQVPDNLTSGGNKRGENVIDLQMNRAVNDEVALANFSFIGGGKNNKITTNPTYSVIVGGDGNVISGTGNRNFIGGGQTNTITGASSSIPGGLSNLVSANYGFAGGRQSTSSADYAQAYGFLCVADALYARAGGNRAITRAMIGADAWAANFRAAAGDAQSRRSVLNKRTTDATLTSVTSDAAAASGTNQFLLPTGSGLKIRGQVIARNASNGDCGWWDISGACKNVSGTVSLSGTPTVTAFAGDAGMSTCAVAVVADNTNKCIQINVTGIAATTIDWVAEVASAEAA